MTIMRGEGCFLVLASALAAVTTTSNAFAPPSAFTRSSSTSTSRDTKCQASMKPIYDALCGKVVNELGLQETDFAESMGGSTWSCPTTGATGTASWWSESNPTYLTGVSLCSQQTGQVEKYTCNIWMGPSYDAPHMLLTFGEHAPDRYAITAEYVPRGAVPLGSDPQYMENYYGDDVQHAWDCAYTSPGATAAPPSPAFESRLLYSSPGLIQVQNIADPSTAEQLIFQHVDRFVNGKVQGATPIAARLRGSFNMRDDKLRQFYYRGQCNTHIPVFGEQLGALVAAVNTGPTAEAYVGGGS